MSGWYDSGWLRAYHQAKNLLRDSRPDKVVEFVTSCQKLAIPENFEAKHERRLFDANSLAELNGIANSLSNDDLEMDEFLSFGRQSAHHHPGFDNLHQSLTSMVTNLTGVEVEPSYTHLALYNNFGSLPIHMDAPDAGFTIDICLKQSEVWPIYVSKVVDWPITLNSSDFGWDRSLKESLELDFKQYCLEEGDALLFGGCNQWHYRDRIPRGNTRNFCKLLFLHYVPKGCKALLDPLNWAEIFELPELASIEFQLKPLRTGLDSLQYKLNPESR